MKIGGQFFSRREAAVHADQFHQIYDGMFPIKLRGVAELIGLYLGYAAGESSITIGD